MTDYVGIYRGEIASIDDPDSRYRYRVRVIGVHATTIPAAHLPFAAVCAFSGKDFGDVPHFEVGDRVFVMFENVCRDHPVIVGSWVAGQEDQAGNFTPDFPPDQSDAYSERRKRWQRVDRDGNEVRLTEGAAGVDDESIRLTAQKKLIIETKGGHLSLIVSDNGTVTIGGDLTVVIEQDADIEVKGNADIEVEGDANVTAATGNITITADQGNITIKATAGTVDVEATAGPVNIKSADVRLGNTPAERVVTETRLMTAFNTHVHPDPASGNTGVPVVPLTAGVVGSPEVQAT